MVGAIITGGLGYTPSLLVTLGYASGAAGVAQSFSTGSVFYLPVRMTSGIFTSSGVDANRNLKNLRAALPGANVKWTNPDGTPAPAFFKFMQWLIDVFMAGSGSLTVADIISAVTTSQANAVQQAAVISGLSQQVQTNAESQSAAREVIVNSGLPGASHIPPIKLSPEPYEGGGE